MFHPNQLRTGEALPIVESIHGGACLVAGCTCKDARIVSHRRAAFFAGVARKTAQTANREIAADPDYRIHSFEGAI